MEFIDLKSLGKKLSLSVYTLRKFIKAGMPRYKVGNKYLVDIKEVEFWFAQHFRRKKNIDNKELRSIIDDIIDGYDQ